MNRGTLLALTVLVIAVVAFAGYLAVTEAPRVPSSTSSPSTSVAVTSVTSTSTVTSSLTGLGCGVGSVSEPDWTTYHGSGARTGYVDIAVSCADDDWRSVSLDGDVYAEPLVSQGMVIVATENDSVYALNSTSGAIIWRAHVGSPVPGSALPCGDIDPSGITGTPVIDPVAGTVYVVAFETPGTHYLVGLALEDGHVESTTPADPPGADPLVQQERGALALANGRVYVPYGGLEGDCGDYHGWVVGLNADGSGGEVSYEVPTNREGGIWAPSGIAVNPSGDLFVATGNGDSTTMFDHGDSVIELSPELTEIGYFAPSNWAALNAGDTDLGSVGPMLLSPAEIFQIGKEGVGYLIDAASLGGIGGQVFGGRVCSSAFGGDAAALGTIFVPCDDGLFALSYTANAFKALWNVTGFAAGPPVVTGGVVWALDTSNGTLLGYAAGTGSQLYAFVVGGATRFTTPSVGEGRVFLAAGDRVFAFVTG